MAEATMSEAGAASHRGMPRGNNEDRLAMPPLDLSPQVVAGHDHLYIVADGMGGHRAGEGASEIATAMGQYYADPTGGVARSLARSIQDANTEVHRHGQDPALAGMGTTVLAAVIQGDRLTVAHMGDSQADTIGPDGLRRLFQENTWPAVLVRDGFITEAEANQHPQRHKRTQAEGLRPEVKVDVTEETLAPGEQVLPYSDGLWDAVSEREIQETLWGYLPQVAAQQLVEVGNNRGGPDNVTLRTIRPQPWTPMALQSPQHACARSGWIMVLGIVVAVVILAGLADLVVGAIGNWILPIVPDFEARLVRNVVLPGDTREHLAQYFPVAADLFEPELAAGRKLEGLSIPSSNDQSLDAHPSFTSAAGTLQAERPAPSASLQLARAWPIRGHIWISIFLRESCSGERTTGLVWRLAT